MHLKAVLEALVLAYLLGLSITLYVQIALMFGSLASSLLISVISGEHRPAFGRYAQFRDDGTQRMVYTSFHALNGDKLIAREKVWSYMGWAIYEAVIMALLWPKPLWDILRR